MNLSDFSFIELNKLFYQISIEYFKRVWWLYLIVLIIIIIRIKRK